MDKKAKNIKPKFFKNRADAPRSARLVDIFDSGLRELFKVRNPELKDDSAELKKFLKRSRNICGIYIYFPWNKELIYSLPEKLFFEVRTARNKNLITSEDQTAFYRCRVGIAGLSIGSNILWPLLVSGGGKFLRVADPDIIEITNLNRLFYSVAEVQEHKVAAALKKAYSLNPFIKIDPWAEGVHANTAEKFLTKYPRLNVLVDEIDDLELKIVLRIAARKHRIPMLMVTNLGRNILLDVERFDQDPHLEIFHGLLGKFDPKDFRSLAPHSPNWIAATKKIIDQKYFDPKLLSSLPEVGKTLAGAPQLGIASAASSAFIAWAIFQIATGQKLTSGRYVQNLELGL
jgi:hypothetical protein